MCKKLTKEQFIEKAKQVHGSYYDYALVEYVNTRTKVKIICKKHGIFEQAPSIHLENKGCCKCGRIRTFTMTNEQFIEKAKQVHGNVYDYSLVKYTYNNKKVNIICSKHGIFEQKSSCHLKGDGCKLCYYDNLKSNNNNFIKKSKDIHGNTYDYSLVEYNTAKIKVKIICKKHGVFLQKPCKHLENKGCPKCGQNYSKGEIKIEKYFLNNNINYNKQYTFDNCKNKRKLPFDFYLPDYNICVEFDGIHHYEPFYGLKNFTKTIKCDKIKDTFCIDNNIKLIRIPYWEFNKIDEIMINMICIYCK